MRALVSQIQEPAMMSRDAFRRPECGGIRFQAFDRARCGVVYLCAALQTLLERRRTFADVMGEANPRALLSGAKRAGKFPALPGDGFQVRFYSLRSVPVYMRVIFHPNISAFPLGKTRLCQAAVPQNAAIPLLERQVSLPVSSITRRWRSANVALRRRFPRFHCFVATQDTRSQIFGRFQ